MSYVTAHWAVDPTVVVVGITVLAHESGLHHLRTRATPARTRTRRLRSLLFYAGLATFLVAVTSPVDYWAGRYFFVHMIEHLLISFAAPTLIVLGAPWVPLLHALPVRPRRRYLRAAYLGTAAPALRAVGRFLLHPWTAVVSFNAAMLLWHVPVLFDLAQNNRAVHVWLLHGTFLVTGILFWLQVIPSHPHRPARDGVWVAGAIVVTDVVMFLLAMSLSIFTASSWYSVYAHVPGVRLSPVADQQIGAAILWVCGDFWAVPALVVVIRRVMESSTSFSDVVDRMLSGRSRAPVEPVPDRDGPAVGARRDR